MSDFPSGGLVERRAKGGIEFSVSSGFSECGASPRVQLEHQRAVRAQNKVPQIYPSWSASMEKCKYLFQFEKWIKYILSIVSWYWLFCAKFCNVYLDCIGTIFLVLPFFEQLFCFWRSKHVAQPEYCLAQKYLSELLLFSSLSLARGVNMSSIIIGRQGMDGAGNGIECHRQRFSCHS